jgi:hypothetical protein
MSLLEVLIFLSLSFLGYGIAYFTTSKYEKWIYPLWIGNLNAYGNFRNCGAVVY